MRFALFAVMLLLARGLDACSCYTMNPKTQFKLSDAVFLGEVIGDSGELVRFRPVEIFKGEKRDAIDVQTGGTSCAYRRPLTPGSRHLIYAYREGDPAVLTTSMCTRSALEGEAACDLRYLRSRAWWWRLRLSSLRLLAAANVYWPPCDAAPRPRPWPLRRESD